MDRIRILGGRVLTGEVPVRGAKNAALPALAATLLSDRQITLRNLPRVRDVDTMEHLIRHLGATVTNDGSGATLVRTERSAEPTAPYDLVRKMRASILVLGPLLARARRARVSLPGGCAIGERPVNLHLDGLARLGAKVRLEHGYVVAEADKLRGGVVVFPERTVTGTENLMMAASLAEGRTLLRNCAMEPEIVDLADLLVAMGARIKGAGTDAIDIEGVSSLGGAEHRIIPDRIEAGTFLMAGAITRGTVRVTDCVPEHLTSLIGTLEQTGLHLDIAHDSIATRPWDTLNSRDISTAPYPGFSTDLQAQYMALMTQATGVAIISENIFENRFMHVSELRRMGADIKLEGHMAVVRGPATLAGAPLMGTDLRASASLILAALTAKGESVVNRVYHLDRGYERIEERLSGLGADIERIS